MGSELKGDEFMWVMEASLMRNNGFDRWGKILGKICYFCLTSYNKE